MNNKEVKLKTCCITGHRVVNEDKIKYVKDELRKAILELIEQGYSHFISGFADGVDLYFAEIIIELKEEHNLTLEAAIPYRNRVKTGSKKFKDFLSKCNTIGIHSEDYNKGCHFKRNRFMVEISDLVLCVYDGREKGGTLYTIRQATMLEKEVKIIKL